MKICHVISSFELGGSQLSTLRLIKAMEEYPVDQILLAGESGPAKYLLGGLTRTEIIDLKYLKRAINPFSDAMCLLEIKSFLNEYPVDIIHTHSSKSSVLFRLPFLFRKDEYPKRVHTYHGLGYEYWHLGFMQKLQIMLEYKLNRQTSIQFICEENRNRALLKGLIDDDTHHEIIRDILVFNPERHSPLLPKKGPWIGSVLSFKEQKQPDKLLKIIELCHKKIPLAQFILVGDGPLRKQIQRDARQKSLPVHFTGAIPDTSLWLRHFDCFLSVARFEGLSMAELECLHYQIPMVITPKGGIVEFMQHGQQGYFIAEENLSSAVAFIDSILNKNFNYKKSVFSEHEFHATAVADKMHRFYRTLLGEEITP